MTSVTHATQNKDTSSQKKGTDLLCNVPLKQEGQSNDRLHQRSYAEGGGAGVVVKDTKSIPWFCDTIRGNPSGYIEAHEGDGLVMSRPASSGNTVQKQQSPTIKTNKNSGVVVDNEGKLRIRYLTPRECLRLMGFHETEIDKLTEAVPSKTNLYKLAGNSIVVDCLEAIFKSIYIDRTFDSDRKRQKSLDGFFTRVNPIVGRSAEEVESETERLGGIGE